MLKRFWRFEVPVSVSVPAGSSVIIGGKRDANAPRRPSAVSARRWPAQLREIRHPGPKSAIATHRRRQVRLGALDVFVSTICRQMDSSAQDATRPPRGGARPSPALLDGSAGRERRSAGLS
jgi:hypothetical protein